MTADHNVEIEELMAWLDGELPAAEVARVRAHVAECARCQQMEGEMRQVTDRLAQWTVGEAPASLKMPSAGWRRFTSRRWLPLAAGLVLTSGVAVWMASEAYKTPRQAAVAAPPQADVTAGPLTMSGRAADSAGNRANERQLAYGSTLQPDARVRTPGPLLVRTARLTVVPRDFEAARAEIERIVVAVGGFTGQIAVTDARAASRTLSATLRVPTARLDEVLTALKRLGHVEAEGQDGEDVTQQSVDLDARLSNARASEVRLKDVLATRTGKLSDVLDVEREIARVRGEIEQMEAQRKLLDRRITYAVISITMNEQRKAEVDLGPLPIATRLRNAFVDGCEEAISSALEVALLIAGVAPVLLLWAPVFAVPAWFLRRRRMKFRI